MDLAVVGRVGVDRDHKQIENAAHWVELDGHAVATLVVKGKVLCLHTVQYVSLVLALNKNNRH